MKMRSYVKMLMFVFCPLICFVLCVQLFVREEMKCSSNSSLSLYLQSISDGRIRLAKLIGKSVLGPISMWIAFPTSDKVIPGGNWYDQVWEKNDFGGYQLIDEIISLSPCHNYDKIFLQIGAHLGAFPLVAAYRKCFALAVEPIPAATNFVRLSALLNNWSENEFVIINAAGSNENGGFTWFDPKGISLSSNNESTFGKVKIPFVTVDYLNEKYGYRNKQNQSDIAFVVIDVEGHEQEVLLGSQFLIQQRSVLVYQIEVWTQIPQRGLIKSYPGLQLLINNGYHLYTLSTNTQINFKICDSITNRLNELPQIFNQSCRKSSLPFDRCLGEVFAIRSDLPPLKQWFSECPK